MVGQSNHSVNWICLLSKYALNCLHMHGLIPFVCPRATLFKLQNAENCCAVIWSIGLCEIFNSLRYGRMPKSGTDDRRQFVKYNFCNGAMTGFSKRCNGNQNTIIIYKWNSLVQKMECCIELNSWITFKSWSISDKVLLL